MKIGLTVEITSEWLKLVFVRLSKTKPRLLDYQVKKISSLSDGEITQVLIETLKESKYKVRTAILCLSRHLLTVRNFNLPSQDPQELAQMVNLNIVRIVPYRKEEIISNFRIVGKDYAGFTKVILAIAHNEVLNRQFKILERAGLDVEKIFVSSWGVWEWVLARNKKEIEPQEIYLALDIDSSFCDFIIFSRSQLLFSRSIPLESANLRERAVLKKFIGELKQSLVIFQSEEINKRPAKIFIGGVSFEDDFFKIFEEELGIPVKYEPLDLEKLFPSRVKEQSPCSLTAVLQLVSLEDEKPLELILPQIEIRAAIKQRAKELFILGGLVVYIMLIFGSILIERRFNLDNYLRILKEKEAPLRTEIEDLEEKLKKVRFVRGFLKSRLRVAVLLERLEQTIPFQIALETLSLDRKNRVSIKGRAQKTPEVFRFRSALEDIKEFVEVNTKYIQQRSENGKQVVRFEINFLLNL